MSAEFEQVMPPADGLALAFLAARRRRAGTASVTAFGAAVAIASVLSLIAPPGQTLVQQPLPPADRIAPVPGVLVAPPARRPAQPSASTPVQVTAPRPTPAVAPRPAPVRAARPTAASRKSSPEPTTAATCRTADWLACATVRRQAQPGRAGITAGLCRTAVAVRVDYTAPIGSTSNAVELRTGRCGSL